MCPFELGAERGTSITRRALRFFLFVFFLWCGGACALLAATRRETAPLVPPCAVPCTRSSLQKRRVTTAVLRAWGLLGAGSSCCSCSCCRQREQTEATGAPTSIRPHHCGRAWVWRAKAQRDRGCSVCSGLTKRGLARRGAPSGSRFFFVLFFYGWMSNCSAWGWRGALCCCSFPPRPVASVADGLGGLRDGAGWARGARFGRSTAS